MTYEIEGRLLEVCTCNVLCPCWVGEDPDNKTCDTVIAWGIETGTIDGVAVDGLTLAVSAHIPKNILIPKSWKAVVFVDDRATSDQEGALLKLFTGQLGGAVADLAGLIGEVVAVERAPIIRRPLPPSTVNVIGVRSTATTSPISPARSATAPPS